MRAAGFCLAACALAALFAQEAFASILRRETAAAFDRYVELTEARMAADVTDGQFLVLDSLPASRGAGAYEAVRQGEEFIEPLLTLDNGQRIKIPGGMIHHWIGVIFIPRAAILQVSSVINDYPNQAKIYGPEVQASKLLSQKGNEEYQIYLRLYSKSIVTVVYNGDFEVKNKWLDGSRLESRSYSTRIAEVDDPGQPNEHEYPVGHDHGYVWRLYSYWRLEQKDGGTYVQVEIIELSRGVPPEFAWLVDPLIENIPRKTLSDLLQNTRRAVLGQMPK